MGHALPPGPDAHTALQTLRWLRNPTGLLEECGARYGDIFSIKLPFPVPVVMTQSPEAVKEVFALGSDAGHAGKANIVLKPFLGEHSVLVLDGPEHLRQRKMMMPAFHGERMQAYGRAMIDAADASIDGWPVGRPFAVHRPMQTVTLQVILRTVIGMSEGPLFEELAVLLAKALDAVSWPPMLFPFMQKDLGPWSPWGKFRRIGDRVRAILLGEIRALREKGTGGRADVLSMMVEAKDENGQPLTEDEIHDELITLLVAGHETTATSLCWALRWLLRDEALARRVSIEAQDLGADPAKIAKSELLDRVVKEALRLQPVIPLVGRVLQEPMSVLGWELPAGVMIAPCIQLVHRRPSLYPEPLRFDPDRYASFNPKPWEWFPFGGGLRKCIGAAFAVYEMKMVLATAMARLSLRLASDDVRVVRRGITLTPSGGLPIVIRVKRTREKRAAA